MEETIMFLHQSIMESHRTLQKYLTRSSETRKRIHAVHLFCRPLTLTVHSERMLRA